MGNRIEDIEVYSLSMEFGDEVWKMVNDWDKFTKDTLGKQLIRSADSISANIAEGFGRYHYKDNKNFCYYSRGSIIETKSWLTKAYNRQLIKQEDFLKNIKKLETIYLKLNTYIKYIGPLMTDD
ncbi:four helix bundle protein [Mucilaginibacter sp. RS28]|uniref:Four helix bundle protein n=1 Tax=Mucilaginibacter straminoryzae TaxID=2932774 RepID=A0A9X2BCW2_9SPHI|nr:four helix bundle protein [Mucilaginibacter straminoryzae]MCJ8211427.1 four helix bundle protein [Mucilaginibacter straminoryzae]